MGKKNRSTWRDPTLTDAWDNTSVQSPNQAYSISSKSTVPGPAKRQPYQSSLRQQTGRSRFKDKSVFRASSKTGIPNDRADAPHAPWDEVPGEVPEKPRITVLTRNNLKAHEIAVTKNPAFGRGATARTVSDLIDLESCDYDALQKDPTVPKAPDEGVFNDDFEDDTDRDPFQLDRTNEELTDAVQAVFAQHDMPAPQPQQPPNLIHYSAATAGSGVYHEIFGDISYQQRKPVSSGQQTLNSFHPAPTSQAAMSYSHLAPDGSTYYNHQQQQDEPEFSSRKSEKSSPARSPAPAPAVLATSDDRTTKLDPRVPEFSVMTTAKAGEVVETSASRYIKPCRNEALAQRPSIGRPNTKILTFAVLKNKKDASGEHDLFSVHSHLVRRYCPHLVYNAERNDAVRDDGSFVVDPDSVVAAEFSIFIDWLYSGKLMNSDETPLGNGQLMRLYRFAFAEEIPLLRDDILTDLCRLSKDYPDYKPSPVLFYKFDSDSMLCKLVADIWSNHDGDLNLADIERAAAQYSDTKPMLQFMKLAWSQANKNAQPKQTHYKRPCTFHEHPEFNDEEIDAPSRILWDWL